MKNTEVKDFPTGGESSPYSCPKCDSQDTVFEEFVSFTDKEDSELGIKCQDCDYLVEPEELLSLIKDF